MKNFVVVLCFGFFIGSCGNDTLPKPKPYLKLQYSTATYSKIQTNCPYRFEVSDLAIFNTKKDCWASISYPQLKATIHITYRDVENNLEEILKEVEKLTFEHTVKADAINAVPYENNNKKVYGKLYNVDGNVATNIQFRVTDSTKHVLSGALYFHAKPNYDSIAPALKYLEKDIVRLVETLEWE